MFLLGKFPFLYGTTTKSKIRVIFENKAHQGASKEEIPQTTKGVLKKSMAKEWLVENLTSPALMMAFFKESHVGEQPQWKHIDLLIIIDLTDYYCLNNVGPFAHFTQTRK